MTLDIRELSKRYPNPAGRGSAAVVALEGVSLSLAPGEFVAVQGPSGSGKSTLLLAAGGLLSPSSGVVSFQQQDIYSLWASARAQWRARHVGFVFQQFHLVPYLNVRDNVLAPLLAWRRPESERRADELLERFGLAPRAAHVPAELSIGEQQRTALARALLHQPQLLLCDEPTGNLDEQSAKTVLDCLLEFQHSGGSVLLVTHHAAAAAMAQRTLHLRAGQLITNGSA